MPMRLAMATATKAQEQGLARVERTRDQVHILAESKIRSSHSHARAVAKRLIVFTIGRRNSSFEPLQARNWWVPTWGFTSRSGRWVQSVPHDRSGLGGASGFPLSHLRACSPPLRLTSDPSQFLHRTLRSLLRYAGSAAVKLPY